MLREYNPEDLQALYEIDSACFPPGVSYSLGELRGFINHRRAKTWVAVDGARAVGFAVAHKQPGGAVHVVTIDVVRESCRRGIGSELMDAVEAWARREKCRVVSLETGVDNLAAQAFYERRDYEKLERIEGYYGNGTAAWVMFKRLR